MQPNNDYTYTGGETPGNNKSKTKPKTLHDIMRAFFSSQPTLDQKSRDTIYETVLSRIHTPSYTTTPSAHKRATMFAILRNTTISCTIIALCFMPFGRRYNILSPSTSPTTTPVIHIASQSPGSYNTVHAGVGRIVATQGRFVIENDNALSIPQTTIYNGDRITLPKGSSLRFTLGSGTDARISGPASFKIIRDKADPITYRSRYRLILLEGEIVHITHQPNAHNNDVIIETPNMMIQPSLDMPSDLTLSLSRDEPTQISNNSSAPLRVTTRTDMHTTIDIPTNHTAHTAAPSPEKIRELDVDTSNTLPSYQYTDTGNSAKKQSKYTQGSDFSDTTLGQTNTADDKTPHNNTKIDIIVTPTILHNKQDNDNTNISPHNNTRILSGSGEGTIGTTPTITGQQQTQGYNDIALDHPMPVDNLSQTGTTQSTDGYINMTGHTDNTMPSHTGSHLSLSGYTDTPQIVKSAERGTTVVLSGTSTTPLTVHNELTPLTGHTGTHSDKNKNAGGMQSQDNKSDNNNLPTDPSSTVLQTSPDDDITPLLHHTYIVKECRDLIYYTHTHNSYSKHIALTNITKKINSIAKRLDYAGGILTNPTPKRAHAHALGILDNIINTQSLNTSNTAQLAHLVACLEYTAYTVDTDLYAGSYEEVFTQAEVPSTLIK